jgi:hypothetical protein
MKTTKGRAAHILDLIDQKWPAGNLSGNANRRSDVLFTSPVTRLVGSRHKGHLHNFCTTLANSCPYLKIELRDQR